MKPACLYVSEPYQSNRIFNISDKKMNRDNCLAPFSVLRNLLAQHDIDLSTQDIHSPAQSVFTLYNDIITDERYTNDYLLLLESEIVVPQNWDMQRLSQYQGVFTWDDRLIDNRHFHKINYSYLVDNPYTIPRNIKSKFCAMIIGNKRNRDYRELYSERRRAIRWFERHAPQNFDLYGMGWDQRCFTGKLRHLNRIPAFKTFGFKPPRSFKGLVESKLETYNAYKFALCFENARDIPGYITEKPFDSLLAGTIPIYYGAPNVGCFIPKECFIDFRDFVNYEKLYSYLQNMSEDEYQHRINAIQIFLNSEKFLPFSAHYFAETITNIVLVKH